MPAKSIAPFILVLLSLLALLGCPPAGGPTAPSLLPAGWQAPDPALPPATLADEPPAGTMGFTTVPAIPNGAIVVWADIATPAGILRGGQVLVGADGLIKYVGADASAEADYPNATKLCCKYGLLLPGLIDASRHLAYAGRSPLATLGETYDHRHEWRIGLMGHTKLNVPATNAYRYDEVAMVLTGTTATVNGGSAAGLNLVRNLASPSLGLANEDAGYNTFPLGDSSGLMTTDPKAYTSSPNLAAINAKALGSVLAVAQGLGDEARTEFIALSDATLGMTDILGSKTLLEGCAGLKSQDLKRMADTGTTLVWTPRSDLYLYGDTARVTTFAAVGGNIALGSYWTATGSSSLLRELRAAWEYNRDYLGRRFSPKQIVDMATANPAKAFGLDGQLGSIAVGKLADLFLVDTRGKEGYLALLEAEPSGISLVLRGGKTLCGNADLVAAMPDYVSGDFGDSFKVGSVDKLMALPRELGLPLVALQAAYSSYYPLPLMDGTPVGEPPIAPHRGGYPLASGDSDGDGILDAQDKAPGVFNPLRPLDHGIQGDADGDGIGDEGDATPFGT